MAETTSDAGTYPLSFRIDTDTLAALAALEKAEDRKRSDMARRIFDVGLSAYVARGLNVPLETSLGTRDAFLAARAEWYGRRQGCDRVTSVMLAARDWDDGVTDPAADLIAEQMRKDET